MPLDRGAASRWSTPRGTAAFTRWRRRPFPAAMLGPPPRDSRCCTTCSRAWPSSWPGSTRWDLRATRRALECDGAVAAAPLDLVVTSAGPRRPRPPPWCPRSRCASGTSPARRRTRRRWACQRLRDELGLSGSGTGRALQRVLRGVPGPARADRRDSRGPCAGTGCDLRARRRRSRERPGRPRERRRPGDGGRAANRGPAAARSDGRPTWRWPMSWFRRAPTAATSRSRCSITSPPAGRSSRPTSRPTGPCWRRIGRCWWPRGPRRSPRASSPCSRDPERAQRLAAAARRYAQTPPRLEPVRRLGREPLCRGGAACPCRPSLSGGASRPIGRSRSSSRPATRAGRSRA